MNDVGVDTEAKCLTTSWEIYEAHFKLENLLLPLLVPTSGSSCSRLVTCLCLLVRWSHGPLLCLLYGRLLGLILVICGGCWCCWCCWEMIPFNAASAMMALGFNLSVFIGWIIRDWWPRQIQTRENKKKKKKKEKNKKTKKQIEE